MHGVEAKCFFAFFTAEMKMLILPGAFTAIFAQAVFELAAAIVNFVHDFVVFKSLEGAVKRAFIRAVKLLFQFV